MDYLEREEFKQRMEALTSEEKEIVAKTIPNEMLVEELGRRLTVMSDKISQVIDIFSIKEKDLWYEATDNNIDMTTLCLEETGIEVQGVKNAKL